MSSSATARHAPTLARRSRRWSTDYHDYVFRGGRFIGDFDNMYQHASEVPWHQDTHVTHWDTQIGLVMIRSRRPYGSILEIGCGLGYIAAALREVTSGDQTAIDAFDASREAIRRAKQLHPGIRFFVDNITRASFRPGRRYDLVVIRDLFWYVLERLPTVLRNIRACVRPGGLLYLGQFFPALDRPFVGKAILPTPDALLARLSDYEPIYTALLKNHRAPADGPVVHFLGRAHR